MRLVLAMGSQLRPGRFSTSLLKHSDKGVKGSRERLEVLTAFSFSGQDKMIGPSIEEVRRLASGATVIPVCKDILGDLLTPASAFLRIAEDRRRVFLLESVEGGERSARYSYAGWDPFLVVRGRGNEIEIEEMGETRRTTARPLDKLRELAAAFTPPPVHDLPPFIGGGVGYFAYDLVRQFEKLPETTSDTLGLDDFRVMYFSTILAFDHLRHRIHIIANIFTNRGSQSLESKYRDALARIDQIEKRLTAPLSIPNPAAQSEIPQPVSNLSKAHYHANVVKAGEYIRAGDIFQVVLSQRWGMRIHCHPFDVYRALRFINPSPYMFFLGMDELHLIGASPEVLVKVENGRVEYGPIAGTRPRGKDPEEDRALGEELLRDEKERAEHVMLVDLGRNDLGRVCKYGTVKVSDLMRIERYSHVMHLVSSVEGELRDDLDSLHALEACLPAGTVSGAPKVRAMEIIEELEPCRRGVYGGAVGYMDFSGNLNTCIALRTVVVKDRTAYIQAGGGIVADSQPEREWEESMNKAQALIGAIVFAHEGLR